jgi:hypothetical protein
MSTFKKQAPSSTGEAPKKHKREVVASRNKGQAGKSDYIKFSKDCSFKAGDILNLQVKEEEMQQVMKRIEEGKLSEEFGADILERLEKIPSFVVYNLVRINKD